MGAFTGTLNSNEIFAALFNLIISQQVYANNIAGTASSLVNRARVDGSLYGDTKTYYSTDALKSSPWGNDAEAANLLALHRPPAPACQKITLDVFRQISLTVDDYLSKRAWSTEGAFSEFTSVMLGWIAVTKEIYDATTYNAFFGTCEADPTVNTDHLGNGQVDLTAGQKYTITLTGTGDAQTIADKMANLFDDMTDIGRSYNKNGFLRSYSLADIKVIWNGKFVNKISKLDLPTIFHKDGLMDKFTETMPSRYFGTIITSSNVSSYSAASPTTGKPIDSDDKTYVPGTAHANGIIRSLIERDFTISLTDYHVFAGDEIPAGAIIDTTANATTTAGYGEVYIENPKVMAKVVVMLPPFMSAFEVGTSFYNAKSLTENRYLTWGHNTLEPLDNYPFVTVLQA